MNTEKIRRLIGVISIGFLLLTGVHTTDATEIKFLKIIYGKSIERGGREIINLALLDSSKIRTQDAINKIIQGKGPEGRITQEAASKVAAVGRFVVSNIDRQRGQTILRISKAKARTADIITREEGILGPAAIQNRIRAMNLAKAQRALIDVEELRAARKIEAKERQAGFVRRLIERTQLNWATEEMRKGLFASVQGRNPVPMPSQVLGIIQSSVGIGALNDFRLATTLLENETGQPMTQLLPAFVTVRSSGSARNVLGGWGGFAEFGFFAVTGFIFSMWILAGDAMRNKPPIEGEEEEEEEEEEAVAEYAEYREAA